MTQGAGLAIRRSGHATRLKWHRLRRRMSDPLFGAETLREGMRAGASMELDLRVRRDGGFVVLHDADLARETTGAGLASEHAAEELRALSYRDERTGAPTGQRLLLADDLPALLENTHADALLQLDMKDSADAVAASALDRLAALLDSLAASLIVSGKDHGLAGALASRLPDMRYGIDPSDRLIELYRSGGAAAVQRGLAAELDSQRPATVYLVWPLLLQARDDGLDLVAACQSRGVRVDAWTFTPLNPQRGCSAREWAILSALVEMRVDQITTDEAILVEAEWTGRNGGG
jgi:glycerophosphoryl diester phosphodiesterase